jgi:AcrR family transcriptional regulator
LVEEEPVTQAADAGPGTRPGAGPDPEPGAAPGLGLGANGQPLSRRDRLRAATRDEIIQTARRLLVRDGPESVSLRAIAREMGMTAPGLYRYFSSHEELLRHVIAGIFTELTTDIHHAIDDATDAFWASIGRTGEPAPGPDDGSPDPGCTPEQHTAKLTAKMVAACRAFRRWALDHPGEFALIFGVPLPGIDDGRYDIADECALQFAGTFFALFLDLWHGVHFRVPTPDEIDPSLRDQLTRYRDRLGVDVPVGTMQTFLRCWMLLYGAVSMEVFGHLSFALEDAAPMFEITLTEMAGLVGLRYPSP